MVDFPGVDDEDDSIGELADLLLTIAQIIIFVVDYRYICCKSGIDLGHSSSYTPLIRFTL